MIYNCTSSFNIYNENLTAMVWKNLTRAKLRTFLSVLGISIAIASIVVFNAISHGLRESLLNYGKQTGADIIITQGFIADPGFGSFPPDLADKLSKRKEIRNIDGSIFSVIFITNEEKKTSACVVIGRDIGGELLGNLNKRLVDGRIIRNNEEILLGSVLAQELKLKIGSTVYLAKTPIIGKTKPYNVVGIYKTGIVWEDGSCIIDADVIRKLRSMDKGTYNVGFLFLHDEYKNDIEGVIDSLKEEYPGYSILPIDRIGESLEFQFSIIEQVILIVTICAIFLGAVGTLNTLLMNLAERKKEIGVMSAFGWPPGSIILLFIKEGLLLSILGLIAGSIFGVILCEIIVNILPTGLVSSYKPEIFIQALLVSIVIGFLGSLYPAYKATKIDPAKILRNE